jgi:hypothetical protein
VETGRLHVPPERIETGLRRHLDHPEAAVGLLRLHYHTDSRPALTALLSHLVGDTRLAGDTGLNCSASLAALLLDDWHMAKLFWLRENKRQGSRKLPPATPVALLAAWADVLGRLGRQVRVGFEYDPTRHLPQSGLEALILAHAREPKNLRLVRSMDALLADYPGTEETRMAFLSELSLHEPRNWRLGLRLGLVDLRAFRLREGMEEVRLAKDLARDRGDTNRFLTVLAHEDRGGAIRRALGEAV